MQFSLLFCSQNTTDFGLKSISINFHIFFSISITLIRFDYYSQLLKLVSFLQCKLLKESDFLFIFFF